MSKSTEKAAGTSKTVAASKPPKGPTKQTGSTSEWLAADHNTYPVQTHDISNLPVGNTSLEEEGVEKVEQEESK